MKIKDFFIATGKNLLHVFKRYPVTVIFITMLTIVMAFHEDLLDTLDFGGVWFLSIGAMLSLALETGKAIFKTSKVAWIVRVVVYLIHTIISSVIYFYGNNPTDEHAIALASIGCCIVLAVFCLPFVQRREDDIPFYHYTFNLLKAIVISAVFSGTLLAGICLIVLSFELLFDFNVSSDFYETISIVHGFFIFPMIFMAYIPEGDDIYKTSMPENGTLSNKFVHYILLPLFGIFVIILYLYIISIVIHWELPKGIISMLVTIAMGFMMVIYFLIYPAKISDDNPVDKKILRVMPVLMIPLLLLMSAGIIRRVSDYGLTEARVYLILFHLWLYAICGLLIFGKSKRIIWIPVSYGIFFLSVSILPINVFTVVRMWMHHSIVTQLEASGVKSLPMNKEQFANWIASLDEATVIKMYEKLNYLENKYERNSIDDLLARDVILDYDRMVFGLHVSPPEEVIDIESESVDTTNQSDNADLNSINLQVPEEFRHVNFRSLEENNEFIYSFSSAGCYKWVKFIDSKLNSVDNPESDIHINPKNGDISFTLRMGDEPYTFLISQDEISEKLRFIEIKYQNSEEHREWKESSYEAILLLNEFNFNYIPPVNPETNISSIDQFSVESKPYMTLTLKGVMITY